MGVAVLDVLAVLGNESMPVALRKESKSFAKYGGVGGGRGKESLVVGMGLGRCGGGMGVGGRDMEEEGR